MFWIALATAVSIFIVMWKLDIKKFTGYSGLTDLTLMIILIAVFMGTFSGMVTGMIAGIILSVFLYIAKKCVGAKKLKRTRKFIAWKDVPK